MTLKELLLNQQFPAYQVAQMADDRGVVADSLLSRHGVLGDTAFLHGGMAGSVMETPEDRAKRNEMAVETAMNMMPVAAATVYHGSPHKFSKFKLDKIGTGEGAQAYGHGLYFADNPEVAKSYVPRDFDFEKVLMKNYKKAERVGDYPSMEVYERAMMHKTPKELTEYFTDPEVISGFNKAELKRINKAINTVQNTAYDAGNLYKVDLPDDSIAKMLLWDEPLKKQPKLAKAIYGDRVWPDGSSIPLSHYERESPRMALGTLYDRLGSDAKVSEFLREKGFTGIKYLDQGSRAGGKGTYNYVVFDDTLPRILERNDEPLADIAESLLK